MTDKVRRLAPRIWKEIQKADKILLHCHPSPDPDSFGSALACLHVLGNIGKEVTLIAGDSELPASVEVLPGSDQIERKNYFQINPADFDLFLIVDSSAPNQISKVGEVSFPKTLSTVVIDHHSTNAGFAKINLVDTNYPATSQMLFDLFTLWKLKITPEAALCLLIGIYSDTGGYKYPPTDSSTFLAAAALAKVNPDFPQVLFELENNQKPEQVIFRGLALSSIEHFFDGKVAMAVVSYGRLKHLGIERRHTSKVEISNELKSVVGWGIGISFTQVEPGEVSVSMRTRGKYDVAKIAVATGFGGGHKAAAGATLKMPFRQAKNFLLQTIQKVYPELGKP